MILGKHHLVCVLDGKLIVVSEKNKSKFLSYAIDLKNQKEITPLFTVQGRKIFIYPLWFRIGAMGDLESTYLYSDNKFINFLRALSGKQVHAYFCDQERFTAVFTPRSSEKAYAIDFNGEEGSLLAYNRPILSRPSYCHTKYGDYLFFYSSSEPFLYVYKNEKLYQVSFGGGRNYVFTFPIFKNGELIGAVALKDYSSDTYIVYQLFDLQNLSCHSAAVSISKKKKTLEHSIISSPSLIIRVLEHGQILNAHVLIIPCLTPEFYSTWVDIRKSPREPSKKSNVATVDIVLDKQKLVLYQVDDNFDEITNNSLLIEIEPPYTAKSVLEMTSEQVEVGTELVPFFINSRFKCIPTEL